MPNTSKNNRENRNSRYRNGTRSKSGSGGGAGKPGGFGTGGKNRQRLFSEVSEDHCDVCLNRMQFYAVGRCNHPVCSECSTRMRVLCDQKECPMCRQDMPKVFKDVFKIPQSRSAAKIMDYPSF